VKKTSNGWNYLKDTARLNVKTKVYALATVFTALYTVLRLVQTIPMVGVAGARFSLSDVIAPLYGAILGPYVGGLSVVLGTFLAVGFGKPVVFLGLDFLPALANTVSIGLLVRHKWVSVLTLNLLLLFIFLLSPYTSFFVEVQILGNKLLFPFAWLHILAFLVLLSPVGRNAVRWVESLAPLKLSAGLAVLAFVGTMMQHLVGNILYEVVFGQPIGGWNAANFKAVWATVFFLYPWERLVLIVLAVVIGVPLVRTLEKSHLAIEGTVV